ncbi:MAG: hypothetical protein AAGH89_08540 [Verrucomicrobiota bacterium]
MPLGFLITALLFLSESSEVVEDDFSPVIAVVFFTIVIGILLLMIGVGFALGFLIAASTAAMLAFGILTSSTVVGFLAKKPSAGAKALILQLAALGGALAGSGLAFGMDLLLQFDATNPVVLSAGAIAGLLGGIILALIFNRLWPKLLTIWPNLTTR